MNEPRVEPRASQAGIEDAGFEARVGRLLVRLAKIGKEQSESLQLTAKILQEHEEGLDDVTAVLDQMTTNITTITEAILAITNDLQRITMQIQVLEGKIKWPRK